MNSYRSKATVRVTGMETRCRAAVIITLALVALATGAGRDLVLISGLERNELPELERLGIVINGPRPGGWELEATTDQQAMLLARGYGVKVTTPRIDLVYEANSRTFSEDAWYMTYEHYRDTLITIAQNHSSFVKLETLGYSSNNRLLLALKFSSDPQHDGLKPAVHFEGNIHGDEKISWGILMEMVKYLAANHGTDTLVTRLINTREIWLVPLVNPDGYVRARRYNDRDVDLNRNWGWMWDNRYSYYGTAPMSEPESRAMLAHILRNPFVTYISYHAGTEFISYPWSYAYSSSNTIPERDLIHFLSARYDSYNGYTYGQGSDGMYLINGSTKDFNYGYDGSMGWSIEVHNTKTPPASAIIPTFDRNRGAILEFCHRAGHGINGTVTDAGTGEPVRAQVWVGPANWQSYTHPVTGKYHRFYLPGTYSLTFRAPGYRDTTIADVVVPNSGDSAVTVDVELTPDLAAPLFGFRVTYSFYITSPSSNRTYPTRALGPRDEVCYQLDANKYLALDMGRPIQNQDGADFVVYRPTGTGSATVKVANDWQGPWTTIGTANSAETQFDLNSVGMDSARYVRLEATSTFQLDAIEGVNYTGIAGPGRAPVPGPQLGVASNPSTGMVRFLLDRPAPGMRVLVHDAAGRLVRALDVTGTELTWNPTDSRGALVPAGVYFARLAGGERTPVRVVVTH